MYQALGINVENCKHRALQLTCDVGVIGGLRFQCTFPGSEYYQLVLTLHAEGHYDHVVKPSSTASINKELRQ